MGNANKDPADVASLTRCLLLNACEIASHLVDSLSPEILDGVRSGTLIFLEVTPVGHRQNLVLILDLIEILLVRRLQIEEGPGVHFLQLNDVTRKVHVVGSEDEIGVVGK